MVLPRQRVVVELMKEDVGLFDFSKVLVTHPVLGAGSLVSGDVWP